MALKLFQQNIWLGKNLDQIIRFVHEFDIDVCHFQEVAGSKMSFNRGDDYKSLLAGLGGYKGEIVKTLNPDSDPKTYFGNATIYKDNLKLISSKIIWLKDFDPEIKIIDITNGPKVSRAALILEFEANGKRFYTVNTHLAWGPNPSDTTYKIAQARKLTRFLANIKENFVLSGDFNVDSDTKIVRSFEGLGKNLTKLNKIKFTLNPEVHFLGKKVIKDKIAVDFIFTSPKVSVKKFELITENLSDHYGLLLEFEI